MYGRFERAQLTGVKYVTLVATMVGLSVGFAEGPRKVRERIPGPGAVTLGTFMHITCVFEILCPGNIREVVFKMCVVPCGGGLI